jgi:RNA polymerase sigma-70 factor (family 1)
LSLYATYIDTQLIELLKESDADAFTEIYRRYWDKLFYIAGKRLGDLAEAENIVQDVFMDLWNRRAALHITESVSGYLVIAVKYNIIRFQKKRFLLSSVDNQENIAIPDNTTENLINLHALEKQFHTELSRLPAKCSLAFSLRNDGYSYEDIASNMEISRKTVEMHVSRALRSLRTKLGLLSLMAFFFL